VLDGDEVRTHLSKGLGFSREDRDINIGRISFVASLLVKHGAAVITAAISPYTLARAEARQRIGSDQFVEVYVRCSLNELTRRDVKGLYAKAIAGELKHFTGVSDPYEAPENPDVVVDSELEAVEESVSKILAELERRGFVPAGAKERRRGNAPSERIGVDHSGSFRSDSRRGTQCGLARGTLRR
jgi:adenylyl-sulfate kinase